MTSKELQELMATPNGKQQMVAMIHSMGKDKLRAALLDTSMMVIELSARIEELETDSEPESE